MPPTKMLNYHKWRINVENKHFSDILSNSDQSFQQNVFKSGGWLGDNKKIKQLTGKKGGMINMTKKQDEKEFMELVSTLKKMCQKESFFRQEKVKQIKKLIKNNQYHVSGKAVVEKWFPSEAAF